MVTQIVEGYDFLPTGCEPDDIKASAFAIKVRYRGHYQNWRTKTGPVQHYSP